MKTSGILYLIFGLIVVAGAILHIAEWALSPYLFSAGAAGLIVLKIKALKSASSNHFRIRRLHNIQAFAAVLLVASAYLMFIGSNFWALTLILSAVFDLVVAFRMPEE